MADVPLMNNPMTTAEDIIVGGVSGAPARKAKGSDGDVLTVSSGTVGWAAPAGGASFTGYTLWAPPVGFLGETSATSALTASSAYMFVMNVPGPMYVRALDIRVSTSNSGTVQWGLFDAHSSPSSATKLCGGSGTTGGTGWRQIAASGGPILIGAGSYFLIWHQPASNGPTLFRTLIGSSQSANFAWVQASYVWDDTPDITSGWTDNTTVLNCGLLGDINGSTQVP